METIFFSPLFITVYILTIFCINRYNLIKDRYDREASIMFLRVFIICSIIPVINLAIFIIFIVVVFVSLFIAATSSLKDFGKKK